MTARQEIEIIRSKFVAGEIPIDELQLHVEPILRERAVDKASDRHMREVMNAIELAIYTEPEPQRTARIARILTSAIALLGDA
jgi:hypothetical protein